MSRRVTHDRRVSQLEMLHLYVSSMFTCFHELFIAVLTQMHTIETLGIMCFYLSSYMLSPDASRRNTPTILPAPSPPHLSPLLLILILPSRGYKR